MPARRLLIKGRVQGVSYRVWAVDTARALAVNGWVRNLSSGEVELLAIGSDKSIDALIDRCWRGPPAAAVTAIDVSDADEEEASGFEMRRTA